jgi:hypothetical protein
MDGQPDFTAMSQDGRDTPLVGGKCGGSLLDYFAAEPTSQPCVCLGFMSRQKQTFLRFRELEVTAGSVQSLT